MSAVTYALHGTTIGFDRPVRILQGVETEAAPARRVRLCDPRAVAAPRRWAVRWDDDGSLHQSEDDRGPWFRFRGAFDVHIVGTELVTRVRSGRALAARGVIDLVVPMLRCDEGALALHAAGFMGRDGATLLLGSNGAGKSTLTAIAAAAGRRILADDCIVVDVQDHRAVAHRGVPSIGVHAPLALELGLPGHRRPDDDEDKLDVALPPASVAAESTPVRRIALLGERCDGDDLHEEVVSGGSALAELAEQCHAGVAGTAPAALLESLAALVEAVPVVRVRVPEGFEAAGAALERSCW